MKTDITGKVLLFLIFLYFIPGTKEVLKIREKQGYLTTEQLCFIPFIVVTYPLMALHRKLERAKWFKVEN